jgi:hypothetical protein
MENQDSRLEHASFAASGEIIDLELARTVASMSHGDKITVSGAPTVFSIPTILRRVSVETVQTGFRSLEATESGDERRLAYRRERGAAVAIQPLGRHDQR